MTGREEMKKLSSVLARRRQEERQERKDRILEAAKIVFFRGGYLGATVRDIALEAELSTGLIYHYFAGKDAVYGKVCEEAFGVLLDVMKSTDLDGLSVEEDLTTLTKAYVRFYTDYPELFEILSFRDMGFKRVGLPEEISRRLDSLSFQAVSMLNDVILKGMEKKSISKVDNPWEMTIGLWSMIEGIIFNHKRGYLDTFGLDLDQLVERQLMILFDGIRVR